MNSYELTVLLRTMESDSLIVKVKDILQKYNVTIKEEAPWGVKKLAYEIDGEKEAYYFFAIIEAAPESIKTIINDFRLIPDILRYLFVKNTKAQTA